MILENIKQVEENIIKSCEKVGRDPKEVTLIGSKQNPHLTTAIEERLYHFLKIIIIKYLTVKTP